MNTKHTKCKQAYVVPSIRWVGLDNASLMAGSGIGLTSVIDFKTLQTDNPRDARVQQNSSWGNPSVEDETEEWSSAVEE